MRLGEAWVTFILNELYLEHVVWITICFKLSSICPKFKFILLFGQELERLNSSEGKERLIQDYIDVLHEKINAKNLRLLVNAFLK